MERVLKARRSSEGLTLIELMVAVAIGSLLLGALMLLVGRSFQINREQFEQAEIVQIGRTQMERISDAIRNATDGVDDQPWLLAASDSSITFHANVDDDADIERVQYTLNGSNLERTVWQPPLYQGSGETAIITRSVRNNSSGPLPLPIFTYYALGNPDPLTGQPTAANVGRIGIRLVIDVRPGLYPDAADISTQVTPRRNLTTSLSCPKPAQAQCNVLVADPNWEQVAEWADPAPGTPGPERSFLNNDANASWIARLDEYAWPPYAGLFCGPEVVDTQPNAVRVVYSSTFELTQSSTYRLQALIDDYGSVAVVDLQSGDVVSDVQGDAILFNVAHYGQGTFDLPAGQYRLLLDQFNAGPDSSPSHPSGMAASVIDTLNLASPLVHHTPTGTWCVFPIEKDKDPAAYAQPLVDYARGLIQCGALDTCQPPA